MFPGDVFAQLVREFEFEGGFANRMLQVYLRLCRTLNVSDPADPLSNKVARTVIEVALKDGRDPEEIYKQALKTFKPGH